MAREFGYGGPMSTRRNDPPDRDAEEAEMAHADVVNGEGRPEDAKRPDPDAPGAGVDDRSASEVPEPNEPA